MQQQIMRRVPLIAQLSDADADLFMQRAVEVELEPGATLFREGDPGDAAYLIIEGELGVMREMDGRMTLIDSRSRGDIIGEMAPLINEPRKATIQARTAVKLLRIDSADFADVLQQSSTAAMAILRAVASRLREMESEMSLNQRMAALGTLSAGLAHELNNPSAALRRAADQLYEAFERWKALGAEMGSLTLAREEREIIDNLLAAATLRSRDGSSLDPLARAESEEALEQWLDDCAVERAWELAATLADAGLGASDLTPLRSGASQEHLATILWWVATGGVISGLLAELSASAGSISDIVAAVKSYTYLDQAPIQEIDVHVGIEQTLMILRHELRQVHLRREFEPDLPLITAWASELNQVWTNLISNAVDAMDKAGELTIRTRCEDGWVIVEVIDNGPGIAPENQPRLFDPFFTTKGPGRGTGLGLHISYSIVTQKHFGTIRVVSHPGQTTFEVALPIEHPA